MASSLASVSDLPLTAGSASPSTTTVRLSSSCGKVRIEIQWFGPNTKGQQGPDSVGMLATLTAVRRGPTPQYLSDSGDTASRCRFALKGSRGRAHLVPGQDQVQEDGDQDAQCQPIAKDQHDAVTARSTHSRRSARALTSKFIIARIARPRSCQGSARLAARSRCKPGPGVQTAMT